MASVSKNIWLSSSLVNLQRWMLLRYYCLDLASNDSSLQLVFVGSSCCTLHIPQILESVRRSADLAVHLLHNSILCYKPYLCEKIEPSGTLKNTKQWSGRSKAHTQASHNALITIPISSRHNPNCLETSHNTDTQTHTTKALWAMMSINFRRTQVVALLTCLVSKAALRKKHTFYLKTGRNTTLTKKTGCWNGI